MWINVAYYLNHILENTRHLILRAFSFSLLKKTTSCFTEEVHLWKVLPENFECLIKKPKPIHTLKKITKQSPRWWDNIPLVFYKS